MENPETASLSAKIDAKRAKRLATVPMSHRKLFERSWTGKPSRKGAVKAFCLECIGFERQAITECTAYACPLWRFRPYQTKAEDTNDSDNQPNQ